MLQSPAGLPRSASGRRGIIFRRTSSGSIVDNSNYLAASVSSTSIMTSPTITTGNSPRNNTRLSFRRRSSSSKASTAAAAKANTKAMADCEIFLSSNKLGSLLSDLPTGSSEWISTLKRSLSLWQTLDKVVVISDSKDQDGNYYNDNNSSEEMVNHNTLPEVDQSMWEITCRLLKGAYYIQEGMNLNRLHDEGWHDYALHAAVGLTSCLRQGSLSLNGLIERLVQQHPIELQKVDPQTGRLPLHVLLTATKYRPDRLPILETLLAVYPKAAGIPTTGWPLPLGFSSSNGSGHANNCSSVGIYPLQLACQSGYPWKGACQDLYKAAPHIAAEVLHQQPGISLNHCPAELRAIQSKASLVFEQELQAVPSKASLVLKHDPSWDIVHDSDIAPSSSLSISSTSTVATASPPLPQRCYHQNDDDADKDDDESPLSSFILNIHNSSSSRRTHDTATISSGGGDDTREDLLFLS
jgi:hypothetical protein